MTESLNFVSTYHELDTDRPKEKKSSISFCKPILGLLHRWTCILKKIVLEKSAFVLYAAFKLLKIHAEHVFRNAK